MQNNDPVNHPSHYTDGKIEVIDFIEDKNLDFNLGNAVKYIARAGKKDPSKEIQDLEKARWYLNRRIANLSKVKGPGEVYIDKASDFIDLEAMPRLWKGMEVVKGDYESTKVVHRIVELHYQNTNRVQQVTLDDGVRTIITWLRTWVYNYTEACNMPVAPVEPQNRLK